VKNAKAAEKARADGISTPQEAEITSGPVGAKKRTVAENGKVLIVDSVGNVFLEDETEEGQTQEFLLDPNEVPAPKLTDTFLVRGPIYLYNITIGRALNKQTPEHVHWELTHSDEQQEDDDTLLKSAFPTNANGETRKRKAKARS